MSKRIMIVDDSTFARMMLKNILTRHGYEVVGEFESGSAAVAEYKHLNPDLVTMDIIMYEMSGHDALEKILSIDPNAKVVIVSYRNNKDTIKKALQAGALDFVIKPFSKDRLLQAIEKALSKPIS